MVNEVGAVLLVGSILLFLIFGLIVLSLITHSARRREVKKQQELLRIQLEIEEQTLKKISQELHDNIGQALSLVKLHINTMNIKDPGKLEQKIDDSKYLISKAIQDLRDLSKSLDTDHVKEMGLLKSIESELEMTKRTASLETKLTTEGKMYRLEQRDELVLFRLFQEALNNIVKHAKANLVTVSLVFNRNDFVLQISDDGKGFDFATMRESNGRKGLGLRNMANRAKIIAAEFDMQSAVNNGTTLKIQLSNTQPKTNVVLIDRHALLRKGLGELIELIGPYRVLFEANNGEEFIKNLNPNFLPEIVILDVKMTEMDGYQTSIWLKNNYPEIKVLVCSMNDEENTIIRMFMAGAKGYMLKDCEPEEIGKALLSIITTGFYCSEELTGHPIPSVDKKDLHVKQPVVLTEMEITLIRLLCTEMTHREIADDMRISPRILNEFMENLFDKLTVQTRVGLVVHAIKNGLVT